MPRIARGVDMRRCDGNPHHDRNLGGIPISRRDALNFTSADARESQFHSLKTIKK
jgi:hypothetical protein